MICMDLHSCTYVCCKQEMEKIGSQRYVVVYFNADADLALIPEPSFCLDAHSALAPSHRRQLKARLLIPQRLPPRQE